MKTTNVTTHFALLPSELLNATDFYIASHIRQHVLGREVIAKIRDTLQRYEDGLLDPHDTCMDMTNTLDQWATASAVANMVKPVLGR